MGLVRRQDRGELAPWSALQDLESQMQRLFGEGAADLNWPERTWLPTADLRETDDHYIVEMDLPGMRKEDVELTAIDNVLTIKGERKYEHKDEKEDERGYRRFERRYGRFERSFEIPGGFDADNVEANYDNGVLHVTLPKREEAKPKQISVNVN